MENVLTLGDEQRFAANVVVDEETGCHNWKPGLGWTGYGKPPAGAFAPENRPKTKPARVAWEMATGFPAPTNRDVRHGCGSHICVNPAHLTLGPVRKGVR